MYLSYFGFADNPFSIAPNPDFLYLSPRHKEALAHLSYGLMESGGFVLLTGEVGTGKTTVARKLMQQLPDNTQLAMILNPALSSVALLQTVCDELSIDYHHSEQNLKGYTDCILARLATNHQAGVNTVLLIDEAQHLQADALEQLRLLTNLETNREKLLKIVLIGQPELQLLLQRTELRQLAQRITARYHLMPLTRQEVDGYIRHRLQVVNGQDNLFSPSATGLTHGLSQGIPRVINLLCDRSLMLCAVTKQSRVSISHCLTAAQHVLGDNVVKQRRDQSQRTVVWMLVVIFAVVGFWLGR